MRSRTFGGNFRHLLSNWISIDVIQTNIVIFRIGHLSLYGKNIVATLKVQNIVNTLRIFLALNSDRNFNQTMPKILRGPYSITNNKCI